MNFWRKFFGLKESPSRTIHDVVEDGDLVRVEMLLKNNPDLVFSKTEYGFTPLHVVAAYGCSEAMARLLLTNNADVNAKNNLGESPLHLATKVSWGYGGAKWLLANKADVNARSIVGKTPLHYAAYQGHKHMVELLLANQANVNAKDNRGMTPSDDAMNQGHSDVVVLLRQNAARQETNKIQLIDWRSPKERIMEHDGATGDVSQSIEDQASRLYAIWRATVFDYFGKKPGEQWLCNECEATKSGRFPLAPMAGGFMCKSCGRRTIVTDYVEDGNHFKHKQVIEIGKHLAKQEGTDAMVAVAYRFTALGGRMSDLSRCWHGVGEWRH